MSTWRRSIPVILTLTLGCVVFLANQVWAEASQKPDPVQAKKQIERKHVEENNTLEAKRMTDSELDKMVAGNGPILVPFAGIGIGPNVGIGIDPKNGFLGVRNIID